MLDVILGGELYNVAVVVTRYFGGVLLGTGGLVRAYSKAAQEGLSASRIIEKQRGVALQVTTDYPEIGKIQYLAGERGIPVLDARYTDQVVMKLLVPLGEVEAVKGAITEKTGGRAALLIEKELYFTVLNGKPLLFSS